MNCVLCAPHLLGIGTILFITLLAGIYFVVTAWLYEKFIARPLPAQPVSLQFRSIPALKAFLLLSIVLTGACYAFLLWWGHGQWWGHVRHGNFPFDSPYLPFFRFWDWRVYQARMPFLHTPQFFKPGITFPWQYPPATVLLYLPVLFRHPSALFPLIVVPLLTILAFAFARRLIVEGLSPVRAYGLVIGVILISYPLWFEMDLGNLEIFIFFLIIGALVCFVKDRSYAAAVLLGLATAMKIFPGVYFGLLLARRQYRQILVGLVTALVATFVGLWILCPDLKFTYHQVQAGLDYNRQHYMLTWLTQETGFDHSGFGFIKQVSKGHLGIYMPITLLRGYMAAAALAGLAIYFLRIQRLPLTNQVAALCVASILLPPTSHDYTLIHLYIPWAMLLVLALRAARQNRRIPGLTVAMLCFAVLMSSESEFIHKDYGYSGQIKCVALVILFGIVLRFRWADDSSAAKAALEKDLRAHQDFGLPAASESVASAPSQPANSL